LAVKYLTGMRYRRKEAPMRNATMIHDINGTEKLTRLFILSALEARLPRPL
jgi:hypothetical protein